MGSRHRRSGTSPPIDLSHVDLEAVREQIEKRHKQIEVPPRPRVRPKTAHRAVSG